ncbi:hypothetical protein [Vibrio sp. H11]|uniref:hypothetical protein n=1 Tax=Vibrio sp. H11 TaxID=2565928 RepID=UPI001455EAC9|nr:hypothetical protein [Vibrio sp. H11]
MNKAQSLPRKKFKPAGRGYGFLAFLIVALLYLASPQKATRLLNSVIGADNPKESA